MLINQNRFWSWFLPITVIALLSTPVYAQQPTPSPVETTQDTLGVATKPLLLPNTSGVVVSYEYDPELDMYVRQADLSGYVMGAPLMLTPKQYWAMVDRQQSRVYLQDKIDAYAQTDKEQQKDKNLLPGYALRSEALQSIFGGDEVSLIPQGQVGVDLGVLWQKNDNPSISPRNRSTLAFDFDQDISLGLVGKIGSRLSINANYNTKATFDFQNLIKVAYTPPTVADVTGLKVDNPLSGNQNKAFNGEEDNILQNVEIGDLSMPLTSSLIQGAQSLFGIKTEMKFGRTTVTTVLAEQRSQNNSVLARGGGTIKDFSVSGWDYEEDRHFFLAHFFRDQFDQALAQYPYINSQVQITRMEVWVTNRMQQTNSVRHILAIQDLGEAKPENTLVGRSPSLPSGFFKDSSTPSLPSNKANAYDPELIGLPGGAMKSGVRDLGTIAGSFEMGSYQPQPGFDYTVLENARKLEPERDYFYDTQLGYLSLSQTLNADEVLAVAFQYTYKGVVYQVGEFANGGIESTTLGGSAQQPTLQNNALVLKLLKSNITSVKDPIWDLMMKNIYPTGAYQLSPEDFRFNILYSDPSPRNYITPVNDQGWPKSPKPLDQRILLDVFNLDRLNAYQDEQPGGDGFFDFIPGRTINLRTGSILFTQVEPFGKYLFDLLGSGQYDRDNDQGYNENQKKYVFRDLYRKTKAAALESPEKNKFILKGQYKSEGYNGIPIGAYNVPRGSVKVRAGNRLLQEGIDYSVNYAAGTVQLLDPSLEASNTPIQIDVENNAVFGQQNKRFTGINVQHKLNERWLLGGTYLNINERPLTQKANYGTEPINNSIFGFNALYNAELPFLTRLANRLPFVETDVPSNLSFRAEMAVLKPGAPKFSEFRGEITTYIDDFEGAQSMIDVRGALGWSLASTPIAFGNSGQLYGNSPTDPENLRNGYTRSKLAWYTIDPIFYSLQRPAGVTNEDLSTNPTRRVYIEEIFPQVDVVQGQTTIQSTLDLFYDPQAKGPYNNNPQFNTLPKQEKWGGNMRALNTTNFEQANVGFVQFWLMDPFVDGLSDTNNPGQLVIDLGNISEDILKDGKKQYENGLPDRLATSISAPTSWGKVPAAQSLVYAFDTDPQNRLLQDVGFDGLSDNQENEIYRNNPGPDYALDNYRFYLNASGSILDRYRDYNNPEGNAPVAVGNLNRGATTLPDVEDLDRDLTMNTIDSYYSYRIEVKPNTTINDRFVTDIKESLSPKLPDGSQVRTRWIQYKIPVQAFDEAVGGIADFRSISFMRMYLTGFSSPLVMRFATLDLVRGDWRMYNKSLDPNDLDPTDDLTSVDVQTFNIEENSNRIPIPYVLPPGLVREQLNNNNTVIRQNEQSLALTVKFLEPNDTRAVFKNTQFDFRQYKRLKMMMHAETINPNDYPIAQTPLVGVLRFGTDFSENYYQIELPLTFTPHGSLADVDIWPSVNEIDIPLEVLSQIKAKGINDQTLDRVQYYEYRSGTLVAVDAEAPQSPGVMRVAIRGNPSLASVRGIMVGVKNQSSTRARGQVWFNELRLTGLDNQGGWAGVAALDANIADLVDVSANARMSTSGFGAVDQMPSERNREDAQSYDLITNINVGQLLPKNIGLQLPLNLGVSETLVTPEFDPVYEDLNLADRLSTASTDQADQLLEQAQDYTKRTSVNVVGLKKNKTENQRQESRFYDLENWTFNYGFNRMQHRDFEIAAQVEEQLNLGVLYGHQFKPLEWAPLAKKDSILTGGYWQWLKEINLNFMPSDVSFNTKVDRVFSAQRFRDVQAPGVESLALPFLQQRNYLFQWQYTINHDITKSLRLNLTASSNNLVRNYLNNPDDQSSGIIQSLSIWDGIFDPGSSERFNQDLQVNYALPFSKIPILAFADGSYTYTSSFEWTRGGASLRNVSGSEMNQVQNAQTQNLSVNMDMNKLYTYLGMPSSLANPKWNLWSLVSALKRVSANYTENNGQLLPGFTQRIGFLGTQKPSAGFIWGSQSDVRFIAAKNGWLTTFEDFNDPYVRLDNQTFTLEATAQPIPDLTIDLSMDQTHSVTYKENFQVKSSGSTGFEYLQQLGNETGNFSVSTVLLGSFFKTSDQTQSIVFEQMKDHRITVAQRLNSLLPQNEAVLIDSEGYPERYGKTQPEVLLPSFIAAYRSIDPAKVALDPFAARPLPNWNVKYTGLMRLDWFKDRFNRFSISHGYRGAMSINGYSSNLEKTNTRIDPQTLDIRPELIFNNVVLTDQFNPLILVDFETTTSLSFLFETKMDRALSMNFDNKLLTEMSGTEFTLGMGYRIKDLKMNTKLGGSRRSLSGDLNLKAAFSLRDNLTVVRYLDLAQTDVSAGQYLFTTKISADYALSQNLSAQFFYDFNRSKYAVSTAFAQQSLNTGFSLRYNFGN